ncbi:hypothetical protein CsSME_00034477 [Camellia sinensis var. sinensis]
MVPQQAKDLVFIHSNLCLLSRRSFQYLQEETKCGTLSKITLTHLMILECLG